MDEFAIFVSFAAFVQIIKMLKEIILLVLVLSCSCARSHKCESILLHYRPHAVYNVGNGDEVNAIRLYNGTSASHSGILQICMYGSWIEICDHSWTQCQSLVVCENVTNVTGYNYNM